MNQMKITLCVVSVCVLMYTAFGLRCYCDECGESCDAGPDGYCIVRTLFNLRTNVVMSVEYRCMSPNYLHYSEENPGSDSIPCICKAAISKTRAVVNVTCCNNEDNCNDPVKRHNSTVTFPLPSKEGNP